MTRFLLLVVCLQALLLAVECCGDKKPSVQPTDDSYTEVCKQEPLELSIVLDASRSIHVSDFEIAKSFLEDYISHFDVGSGREGVRVSVISYGNGTYPEAGFDLSTYNTKEDVLGAICNIKHSLGSYTHTHSGIDYMHQKQLASDVVRPWAKKISIVLTDGDSTFPDRTKAAAEAARQDGIQMFAVGVGKVKKSELLNIAGDASRALTVESYDKLDSIKATLASKTCIRTMKPTTQPPKTEKCGEVNPADVYFAFSPADLGADATAKATSFISAVIADKGLDVGFEFGVVSGSCPLDQGFNLGTYKTVQQYQTRLGQYDLNSLTRLTERLLGDAYSVENGGREGASRVAVIWTSGQETDELALQVQQLKQRGVQVYIVDATGAGVTVNGATILPDGSSLLQAQTFISNLCPGMIDNSSTN